MSVCKTVTDYKFWRQTAVRNLGGAPVVGVVTTMGALHAGHQTLIDQARKECDLVVVTIFVNPTQFGPNEDFDKYPRTLERDLELCEQSGVDCVFAPSVDDLYPDGKEISMVEPPQSVIEGLCGAFRPGHFRGVATVVAKLFNIVGADYAYFGEKDYQQLVVVKRLVRDLNMPVSICPVQTAREEDGLAMSSRNRYLTEEQRKQAPHLYKVLSEVKQDIFERQVPVRSAIESGITKLTKDYGFTVQYLEACDAETLESLHEKRLPMVFLVAAKIGTVRLIDNLIVR
ncbi:MAG: pantoate--beta-alanine ligase [Cyanobacteria bacterium]|nr:pantoate--beta-alanine ligase [Cyanobacteriota bacterium]